ncbi:hypothetical protein FRIGORI9N_310265 [Frigoribacterium sp. 9N]|nr:hypothetical protein FRIGORI9N_310265 [Frigoribacterium sp. 9N]
MAATTHRAARRRRAALRDRHGGPGRGQRGDPAGAGRAHPTAATVLTRPLLEGLGNRSASI